MPVQFEPPVIEHGINGPDRTFVARSRLPVSAETAFAWHERPGAFQQLNPPWESVQIISQQGGIHDGARVEIEVQIGPLRKRWIAEHRNYDPPRSFQDVQLAGPFAHFEHTHRITPLGESGCELTDSIEYRVPFGAVGDWIGRRMVQRKLERTFRYRHHITFHDLAAGSKHSEQAMKILITGATGLIGTELTKLLTTAGHEVLRLTRRRPKEANDIPWDPSEGVIPKARLEGLDAVVHLAGENIAHARWTPVVKERLRKSRIEGTRLLCETLAQLQSPPKTLICASAIGYYGNRGNEILTENSSQGTGFLPELCRDWEAAGDPARQKGIRVVHLRIGVVLSPKGGALAKMLTPFKLGLGGVIGDGKQYWSWVALDDVVGTIEFCLHHPEISGPVNGVSPNPSTNFDFTKTLGSVLHRPTIFPMPAFAARLALGEMADDLLLGSNRIIPERLQQAGYQFRCPTLDGALRHLLGM